MYALITLLSTAIIFLSFRITKLEEKVEDNIKNIHRLQKEQSKS